MFAILKSRLPSELFPLSEELTMDKLCDQLDAFCNHYSLPHHSADELLLEISEINDSDLDLNNAKSQWLIEFCQLWELLED